VNDLLVDVLDAHGGVDRWARVHTITAHLSIGGPFWGRKGWPGIFGEQTTLELDTRREHIVVTPFTDLDRRSVFDVNPERIVVDTNDGVAVQLVGFNGIVSAQWAVRDVTGRTGRVFGALMIRKTWVQVPLGP
jgi:hypothetical protein